jgi:hypothetical protein
MLSGLQ